jgi:outer membrane autotransporter protein
MSAGVDYLITDQLAVGLFGGYSHNWVNFKPSGSGDVDTGRGGLYAAYFDPTGWWVNAAVWGGGSSYPSSRLALLGFANGDTSGAEFSTYGEAGYNFRCGNLAWGPTVAMQYTWVSVDAFNKHGSLIPLDFQSNSQDSLITDVGTQAFYKLQLGKIAVVPNLKLAWIHEYLNSSLNTSAAAPALGGVSTTFNGPNMGHDWLHLTGNVAVGITPRTWFTVGYDGQLARDNCSSNSVVGTFSFSF